MSQSQPTDKSAAFTGLIVTFISLFVIMLATVMLTNMKYAGHAPAAAETSK